LRLLTLLLAVVAYWALLSYDPKPSADLTQQVEDWFFAPADTVPLVVVMLSGWLLYRRRESLMALVGRASSPLAAAVLFGLALAVHAWATLVAAPDLLAFSLMAMLLGLAVLLAGSAGARAVAAPAVFLIFAVPLPGPLMNAVLYAFQVWTTEYSGWLISLLGYPVYVSNVQILLVDGSFEIIEGCSGLRSVQTLTMMSVLLIDLFRRRGVHAAIVFALAPPVAFALNGFRVVALIFNPHSEVAAIHSLQGVVILLAGLVLLYIVDGLCERFLSSRDAASASNDRLPAAALGRFQTLLPAVALATAAALPMLLPSWGRQGSALPPEGTIFRSLRQDLGPWQGWEREPDRAFLGTAGIQPFSDRQYVLARSGVPAPRASSAHAELAGDAVRLFVLAGDPTDRLISPLSGKTQFTGSGWRRIDSGPLRLADGREVQWLLLRLGTERQLAYHWMEGLGGVGQESLRSLLGLDRTPWRRTDSMLVFRMSVVLDSGSEQARAKAHALLSEFYLDSADGRAGVVQRTQRKRSS
jgi:exosortase